MNDKYEPIIDLEERGCVYRNDTSIITSEYEIHLGDDVGHSSDYNRIVNLLRNINKPHKATLVTLFLHNFGGSCDGCVNLVNAIRNCEAPVLARVTGRCASAGSTLALSGDYLLMEPNTELMFHNYSSVDSGKGHELRLSVDHARMWVHQYFRDIHTPFLNARECKKIEKDEDIYVKWDDKDLDDRIRRHFKKRGRYDVQITKN